MALPYVGLAIFLESEITTTTGSRKGRRPLWKSYLDPTPDMFAMPRFDDGAIGMRALVRRLAEQVVNALMDAEADQLCGSGANSRNGY